MGFYAFTIEDQWPSPPEKLNILSQVIYPKSDWVYILSVLVCR